MWREFAAVIFFTERNFLATVQRSNWRTVKSYITFRAKANMKENNFLIVWKFDMMAIKVSLGYQKQ